MRNGQMRQRMVCQIVWMRRRNTFVLQGASGRYGGIFVSRCCTKPPGVLCGVLSMMQQTAQQLARRGEHAERSARAEQTAAGEKCRQMQQQLDQVRELMVQNQAALYRLEDGLGSAFRRREAALCREKAAQEALEEAQRQYRAAKAMPLPAENDPSYAFLEQGRRNALKQGARQIADAQERIRTARQEAEELAVQMGDAAPKMDQCRARLARLGGAVTALGSQIRTLERFLESLAAGLEAYEAQGQAHLSGMEHAIRCMEEPQQLGTQAWKAISAYEDAMNRIRY